MAGEKSLHRRIEEISQEAGADAVGVAFFDYRHRTVWGYHAERWFHAASTIKIPVLLGVYDAVEKGRFSSGNWVHVRNRFLGVVDGAPYRIDPGRDADSEVHAAVGRTMRIRDLARHMIVRSSNLATNLLLDLVGPEEIQATLDRLRLDGIELRRGVEDLAAWEEGVNNRVTAHGLLGALRVLEEGAYFAPELTGEMLDILHAQEFRSGIPAGMPDGTRVAHKTGEISTAAHDAGIVYLPDREPFVLVVLTEWASDGSTRKDTIARIARTVHEYVTEGEGEEGGEGAGQNEGGKES